MTQSFWRGYCCVLLLFIFVAPVFGQLPANPVVLQQWEFNDPAGTTLSAVANSIPGGSDFNFDINNSAATGSGGFVVNRQDSSMQISYAALNNLPATGTVWAVIDVVGWNFATGIPRFTAGFYDLDGPADSTNVANLTARVDFRPGDAPTNPNAGVGGFATGTGLSIGWGSDGSMWGLTSDPQNSPVRLVLEYRQNNNTYEVYYSLDNVNYMSIGSEITDPTRGANFFALGTINNFSGDGMELGQVLILIPEPSSLGLVGLAIVALIMRRMGTY